MPTIVRLQVPKNQRVASVAKTSREAVEKHHSGQESDTNNVIDLVSDGEDTVLNTPARPQKVTTVEKRPKVGKIKIDKAENNLRCFPYCCDNGMNDDHLLGATGLPPKVCGSCNHSNGAAAKKYSQCGHNIGLSMDPTAVKSSKRRLDAKQAKEEAAHTKPKKNRQNVEKAKLQKTSSKSTKRIFNTDEKRERKRGAGMLPTLTPSGRWRGRIKINGKECSCTHDTEEQVEEWYKKLLAAKSTKRRKVAEKYIETLKRWREKNPDYKKQWVKKNPEKRKAIVKTTPEAKLPKPNSKKAKRVTREKSKRPTKRKRAAFVPPSMADVNALLALSCSTTIQMAEV